MKDGLLSFKVRLFVIPTAFGGRQHPVFDGYRPDWKVNPSNAHLNGGMVNSSQPISPGKSGEVVIYPLLQEAWDLLKPGNQITMYEGSRIVGVAILLGDK